MADNFLQPPDDTVASIENPQEELHGIVGYVKDKFESAEDGRYTHEQRWLKAYKNFRGIYDSTTQYRDSERSRVFLRITKTKVLAAFGQITDILFANKKFPIVVETEKEVTLNSVMSNSFGFGGTNAALIFEKV